MKKKWLYIVFAALLCIGLVACTGGDRDTTDSDSIEETCDHSYKAATCTDPAECEKCGKTKGKALGHEYSEATCLEAAKCVSCGKTKGKPLAHDYSIATCTRAATCVYCGKTSGKPLAHTYDTVTLKCTVCGTIDPDRPYAGKTLQIWGIGTQDSYTNYDAFGKGNYLWMMKAAIEEWAEINGVIIEYEGSYNQNAIFAEMSSGNRPDIVFQTNKFPQIANLGFTQAFTDTEYQKLADICGEEFLDMMSYKTKSYGVVYPWSGALVVYYNKTMFENYGEKTPKEYFMEGNWTWETFAKCMEKMTADIDSDGTLDTYGLPADSFNYLVNPWKTDENGRLVSTIDEEWMRDFIQLKYDAFNENWVLAPGKNLIQKNVTYPMYAMQISDCESYNFEHMYQTLSNGDELEVVPVPQWRGDNGETLRFSGVSQAAASLLVTCDERAAAVDLLSYLLKCGMKYMSDYSLGDVECEYAGVQGSCDLSKKWKEAFAKVCADRAAAIKEIRNYDEALLAMINTSLNDRGKYILGTYSGVSALTGYAEIIKMIPANSIPVIREKHQKALDNYNARFFSD